MLKYPQRKSEDVLFRDTFINSDYVEDNGGVVTSAPTINNGITTDGNDDDVNYGNVANLGSGSWSFSMKVSIPVAGVQTYFFSKFEDANNRWYIRANNTGAIFMYCLVGGNIRVSATTDASVITSADTDYSIQVVGDRDDTLRIYVDGSEVSTNVTTFTADNLNNTGDFIVGQWNGNYGKFTMKDLTIYKRALNDEEVLDIYQADTFKAITAQNARYWLPMKTSYNDGSDQVTGTTDPTSAVFKMGDGSDTNTFPSQEDGYFSFDGASDYVRAGDDFDFDRQHAQSFSFNFKTTDNSLSVFMSKSNGESGYKGFQLYQNSGQILFRIYESGIATGFREYTDDSYNDGRWHHLVVTYSGNSSASGVTFYIDGEAVPSTPALDAGFIDGTTNNANLTIGLSSYDTLPISADMYDVAQWDFELTPTQVKELFNNRRLI